MCFCRNMYNYVTNNVNIPIPTPVSVMRPTS